MTDYASRCIVQVMKSDLTYDEERKQYYYIKIVGVDRERVYLDPAQTGAYMQREASDSQFGYVVASIVVILLLLAFWK